jgi:GNAT superfamily N-acetyltransferase
MPPYDLQISTDPVRLDVQLVHRFLSSSYWAAGRSLATVERSLKHSLCFGAYVAEQQVGFGRAISDRAVFAYIADVFVLPEWRGRGIGKKLVQAIVEHPDLRGLQVMLLRTRDAHGLYRPHGFSELSRPEEMMGRYAAVAADPLPTA